MKSKLKKGVGGIKRLPNKKISNQAGEAGEAGEAEGEESLDRVSKWIG